MTEQQIMQIIETLATRVMGWEMVESEVTGKPRWFYQPEKQYCLEISDWNPLQNIADAWMIVEKIKDTDIGDDFDDIMDHFNLTQITPEQISRTVYCLTQR